MFKTDPWGLRKNNGSNLVNEAVKKPLIDNRVYLEANRLGISYHVVDELVGIYFSENGSKNPVCFADLLEVVV